MDGVFPRKFLCLATAFIAIALSASVGAAQTVVVSGRVISEARQPLGGANVSIPELGVGSIASVDGRFNFTVDAARARGRQVNLVARFIGYKPKRLPVTITGDRVEHEFVLERDVLQLEQVVVTGVSEATSQRKTAFAVGVVDNAQLKEAPAVTPIAGLQGRIAGANVVTASGAPGAPPAIRLRAPTSLTGRQDPLIIIDGTITRLSMADINSEDIDRIEVIKGAAASSLYGSDAANGVIQIFTKRGANLGEGQTAFTARTEYGRNYLPKVLTGNMSHNYLLDASGQFLRNANGERIPETDLIADNPYPVYFDQLRQVYKPGDFLTNYVSVGQRRGGTNYNASFQNTKESGVLDLLDGFSRQTFRINLDHAFSEKIDLQTGAFYAKSTSDQADEGLTGNALFFSLRFLEPNIDLRAPNADGTPFNAVIRQPPLSGNVANPLYVMSQQEITTSRNRFTGTFRLNYRPLTWLTAEANVGYDEGNADFKWFTPLGYLNSVGAASRGQLIDTVFHARAYNTGVGLTATTTWRDWLRNTTRAAWQYEDQVNRFLAVNAQALSVPRVLEFSAAFGGVAAPGSRTEEIRNQSFYLNTTFDIKDRYILDGLVRRDESSLFGPAERGETYHRLSAAYRLTEDFRLPGIDDLKLRASYGTAGLRPLYRAQYEVLDVSSGSPEKVSQGNVQLKPAFSREREFGFNVQFLRDYTLEYSFSRKVTADQILNVPVSAATGYRNRWLNAGTLSGNTHELAFGAVLLSKGDQFWRINVTGDRTRQRIDDLKVGPFLAGPDLNDPNTQIFRVAKGQKFGVIYGARWIRTEAQLLETIRTGNLTGTPADYVVNEEGYYVRTSQWRTVNEVPLKYFQCLDDNCTSFTQLMEIGDVNPDFTLGFNTNAQWRSLSATALLSWVKGGNIYNYTRHWPFNEFRDPVIDQAKKPAVERKPTTYYSTFYNNFDANDYFVENGTYVRLRELAVNWNVPQRWVSRVPVADFRTARLGVVGRNLWTSTDYSGYDPDVSGPGGGNPFAYRVDYFTYPAYRTFTLMFELGF